MSLLVDVTALLRRGRAPFAVIGAAAMAVHGVSRATRDLDLLTLAPTCLEPEFWQELISAGVEVSIRRGDADDPLAGVVRFARPGVAPVDVVIGKHAWQGQIAASSTESVIDGVTVPVARPADLVLLKLYAGGPQDAWDIAQLLDLPDGHALIEEVERRLPDLPPECRPLWARIRATET